jgi:ferredoxin
MKIVADKSRCAGHARCAAVAAELFELNDDGYIAFDEKDVPPDLAEAARRGVRACPERALRISGDGGGIN